MVLLGKKCVVLFCYCSCFFFLSFLFWIPLASGFCLREHVLFFVCRFCSQTFVICGSPSRPSSFLHCWWCSVPLLMTASENLLCDFPWRKREDKLPEYFSFLLSDIFFPSSFFIFSTCYWPSPIILKVYKMYYFCYYLYFRPIYVNILWGWFPNLWPNYNFFYYISSLWK